jgi:hypothetical protein
MARGYKGGSQRRAADRDPASSPKQGHRYKHVIMSFGQRRGEGGGSEADGGGIGRCDLEGAPSTMLRMVPLPRCAGEEMLSGPQPCPPPLAGEVARAARRRGDLGAAILKLPPPPCCAWSPSPAAQGRKS